MKKIITMITLLMGVLIGQSQVQVSTITRTNCLWDEEIEKFSKECIFDNQHSSRISFNLKETMFTHTTPDMTSTYYVDFTDHNIEDGIYVYYTTSDVGNMYMWVVDIEKSEIRILPIKGGYLLTMKIKNVWSLGNGE